MVVVLLNRAGNLPGEAPRQFILLVYGNCRVVGQLEDQEVATYSIRLERPMMLSGLHFGGAL